MIYEMVNNCLESVENQWRDLSRAFQRLAGSLPVGDPRIPNVGNPDATGVANGLQLDCDDEQARLESLRIGLPGLRPVTLLFTTATGILQDSETERGNVESTFVGLFGLAAPTDSVEIRVCREQLADLGEFIAQCLQEFDEVTSPEGQRFSIKGIGDSAENIASYPILTSEFSLSAPSLPTGPTSGGAVPLQRTLEGALREVLGRLPKPNDPRSFMAALNQSFQVVEVEGHVEFTWTPRSYAGQTELGGGVTGAQASLYTRGKVALDNSLPLLSGLYPLLPDADEQEVYAARAIVRDQLIEVINEFGLEGGPRVQRVENLFELLLEQDTTGINNQIIPGGKLGYLESVFGLIPGQVNTLEEETNVTNFVVLRDYVTSLRNSWNEFRTVWFGRDLGTRLVLLSRALSVVAESVDEIYAAMNSVFVGPAERQVASFRSEDGRPILVEELLSWVVTFASEEAPRLVHEGGRRGVETIIPTAQRIEGLVRRFIQSIPYEPALPDGLRHPRVRHPLQELRNYLQQVQQLAQDVRRP